MPSTAHRPHATLHRLLLLLLTLFSASSRIATAQPAPVRAPVQAPVQAPIPVREADRACARCHADIVQRYLQSPMANGSGLATDRLRPGKMQHAASAVAYRVDASNGSAYLSFSRPASAPAAAGAGLAVDGRHTLQYFLGSGNLGTTYLYTEDGYLLESPVAFYARGHGYDMAPGLGESEIMPSALPMTPGCMRCHMSGIEAPDSGTRNRFTVAGLPFRHSGITCERCHGDSAAHVNSDGRAPILNPVKLDPAARDSVCINCHLEGDTSVERRGRSVLDYKPGQHIGESILYFVRSAASTDRSVSETEELLSSRCKRASGATMSCMSCHDPHGSPPAETRVAFYRAKCLTCHKGAGFASTHFPATPDCTGCHMPRSGAQDTPHVAWTDHRILRRPAAPIPPSPGLASPAGLTSVLENADVSSRDLALACYKMLLKGNSAFAPKAWTLLNSVVAADRTDPETLAALGYMNQIQGRSATAATLYTDALRLRPDDFETSNNLGTLFAQSGRMAQARALWQQSFARNGDNSSLGINLSIAQCRTGEREASAATLRQVLRFSPDARQAQQRLAAITSGSELCPAP